MKHGLFDEKGLPIAFYDSDIHSDIPQEAVKITEEQWQELINNQGKRAFIKGKVIDISNKTWDGKKWKKKSANEVLSEIKHLALLQTSLKTKQYIEQYYSDIKQRSDIVDEKYWGSWLIREKNYDTNEIYKTCNNFATQILEKSATLESIIATFPEDEKDAWKQLMKVAVRVGWVQMCKMVYKETCEKILKARTVAEVQQIIDNIQFPQYPEI